MLTLSPLKTQGGSLGGTVLRSRCEKQAIFSSCAAAGLVCCCTNLRAVRCRQVICAGCCTVYVVVFLGGTTHSYNTDGSTCRFACYVSGRAFSASIKNETLHNDDFFRCYDMHPVVRSCCNFFTKPCYSSAGGNIYLDFVLLQLFVVFTTFICSIYKAGDAAQEKNHKTIALEAA